MFEQRIVNYNCVGAGVPNWPRMLKEVLAGEDTCPTQDERMPLQIRMGMTM
jgi:hypothetical protein